MTTPHCACGEQDPAKYYKHRPYRCRSCLIRDGQARQKARQAARPASMITSRVSTSRQSIGLRVLELLGDW